MAYDEKLANRVRQALAGRSQVTEKVMFGGLAFMACGHMCCGLVGTKLMVRVRPDDHDTLLREPNVDPMDFTGKPMRGFLYVNPPGTATYSGLRMWLARALEFAETRPPKAVRSGRKGSRMRPPKRLQPAATRSKSTRRSGRRG